MGALEGPARAAAICVLELVRHRGDGAAEVAHYFIERALDDHEAGVPGRVYSGAVGAREVLDLLREGPTAEVLARARVAR